MDDTIEDTNGDQQSATTTAANNASRTRGRPRRPTAQRSVHELVLNLTQSAEKRSQNVNKRQKTEKTTERDDTTTQTSATTAAIDDVVTTDTTPVVQNTLCKTWIIGQKVEARDTVGDWYSAKILAVNESENRVLVHFERWSSRYDQWFDSDSEFMREKSEINDSNLSSGSGQNFSLNEEVLARWTDNRPYPATIVARYEQQKSVLVLFYDGYRKKVKLSQIEKMPKEFEGRRVPCLQNKEFLVKDDHNDYKCPIEDCGKGFRKQSLLSQHLKHYHKSDVKTIEEHVTQMATSQTTAPSVVATTPLKTTTSLKTTSTLPSSTVVKTPLVVEKPEKEPKSRLKRKYVRKPFPTSAVRKSHRQQTTGIQSVVENVYHVTPNTNSSMTSSLVTTLSLKEAPIVTPNTTLPFWDARTVAEIHENDDIDELVHCVCDAREESGLMVQCELCLCWQHAHCMHFDGEVDVPKSGYFCVSCRFPKSVRKSYQNSYQLNHVIKCSRRPKFPFSDQSEAREGPEDPLVAIHALLAATLDVSDVCRSSEDNCRAKFREVSQKLLQLEERVERLERETTVDDNDDNETTPLLSTDADIKRELYLLFNDLKRAKSIVENV